MTSSPIYLTILRQGDINIIDLAEVGAVIPRSETHVDDDFLRELTAEIMHLATPIRGRDVVSSGARGLADFGLGSVMQDLQRIGGLIFSHLLTEPARQRLCAASPCDLYLRLDERLLQIPWELGYDGEQFLATKFRVGRQVITGSPISRTGISPKETGRLKVLLIADPTESLPQAAMEAEHLCQLLDTLPGVDVTLLGGREVRKVPLLAALEAHEVVHFAGHSHYDATTPSKSGWLLHEGLLSAGEISKLSRPPSLVFSNSCQAGTTAQWTSGYRYEGQAFGIGSAFLLAGVQHYIGTFWVVHDEESVGFATAFYHNVVLGRSVGAALLEARHGIIAQKEWQSLTWASYMLYGDPTFTLLPKTTRELEALLPPPHQIEQQQQHPSPPPLHSRRKGDRWLARLRFWRKTFFILAMVVVVCVAFVFIPPRYESPETPTGPSKKERAALQPRAPGKPAPVSRQSARASQKQRQPKAIGVMTFKALRVDPHFEWMRDAIRDHFNSQLTKGADLQVYSKEHLDFLVQKEATTEIEVANQLGIAKMISGSFLVVADKLRIEAHVVNVGNGMFEASDSIEGPVDQFFDLQRQLALKVMDQLHITLAIEDGDGTAEATVPSLKAYKMLLEAEGETGGTAPATPNTPEGEDPAGTKEETLSFLFPGVSKLNVAWAQELPSRPTTKRVPEEEIRQVVESYRQAYENKDLKLLDAVYLTLTPAQREANLRYFQNTQDLKVTISDVHIDVRGNEAAVSYTREDRFVDVDTGQSIKLETRLTKIFSRTDAGWKLVAGKQGTPAATPK